MLSSHLPCHPHSTAPPGEVATPLFTPARLFTPSPPVLLEHEDEHHDALYYSEQTTTPLQRRYERLEGMLMIGEGTYGQVFKARDRETGRLVATKRISQDSPQKSILRELAILRCVQHCPNMVSLLNIVTHPPSRMDSDRRPRVEIVTEFLPTNLYNFYQTSPASNHKQLPLPAVKSAMLQLLQMLRTLQDCSVIHRDIKPANVLVNIPQYSEPITNDIILTEKNGPPPFQLKLCDFGSARVLTAEDPQSASNGSTAMLPNTTTTTTTRMTPTNVCSPCWRAPEMHLCSRRYDYAADMWSVGCIFAELLTGEVLFRPQDTFQFAQLCTIFQVLGTPTSVEAWLALLKDPEVFRTKGETSGEAFQATLSQYLDMVKWPGIPLGDVHGGVLGVRAGPLGLDLLQRILVLAPEDRISVDDALQHPYFEAE